MKLEQLHIAIRRQSFLQLQMFILELLKIKLQRQLSQQILLDEMFILTQEWILKYLSKMLMDILLKSNYIIINEEGILDGNL